MYIQSQHKFDKQPREIYISYCYWCYGICPSYFRTFVDVSVIIVLFKCIINLKNICTLLFILIQLIN